MSRYVLAFAAAFFLSALPLAAQENAPMHAPDFRAPQFISPLYFPPKPNSPFTAIAGHLEPGAQVFTFAIVPIGAMNETGVLNQAAFTRLDITS